MALTTAREFFLHPERFLGFRNPFLHVSAKKYARLWDGPVISTQRCVFKVELLGLELRCHAIVC